MTQPELEQLTKRTLAIVDEVAAFIKNELGKVGQEQVEAKALNSLVSYVDRTAEERLVAALSGLLPGSAFLTEEETVEQGQAEYRWIIDPLDGTTNFLHQLPCFAVSVALEQRGELVLGVIQEVNRSEKFYAWQGGGTWRNGQRIHVVRTENLQDSLAATGFPYRDFGQMEQYLDAFRFFLKNTRGIRRFGAAAIDLAWVACGRYGFFFEYGLSPWDVAAGILIIREAGGVVCNFEGSADCLFGGELIAAGPGLAEEVKTVVSRAFHRKRQA